MYESDDGSWSDNVVEKFAEILLILLKELDIQEVQQCPVNLTTIIRLRNFKLIIIFIRVQCRNYYFMAGRSTRTH